MEAERIAPALAEETEEEALLRHKKKMKKSLWLIAAAVLVIAAALVAVKLFSNPNRSAKAAARATFTTLYISYSYEDFTECTIYNEDCQEELKLTLTAELSALETEFSTLKEWMEEAEESFTVNAVTEEVYDAEDAGYDTAVVLFADAYDGLEKKAITRAAKVTVDYEESYRDESGNTAFSEDSDILWCFEVDGKWYCHPALIEE